MLKRILLFLVMALALGAGIYVGFSRSAHRPAIAGPTLRVSFLDPAMGGGIVIVTPDKKCVLVDPGSEDFAGDIVDYIKARQVKSVSVLITNPTKDRAGALEQLVSWLPVREIVHGEMDGRFGRWAKILSIAETKKISIKTCSEGDSIKIGRRASIAILGPPKGLFQETSAYRDDDSMVAQVRYGQVRILIPSDIRTVGEAYLAGKGDSVSSHVFVIPHNGAYGSASLELLSVVRPQYCVLMAGRQAPSSSVLKRILAKNTGAISYRTDKDGIINVVTDGRSVVVEQSQDGQN